MAWPPSEISEETPKSRRQAPGHELGAVAFETSTWLIYRAFLSECALRRSLARFLRCKELSVG